MFIYFSMLSGLLPIIFILSAIGLIYSFIKKKRKTPWVLGIVGSIIFISIMILFMDEIISRIDMPNDEIKETSEDPEGTLRVKEGKYIVGEKIKEGLYNIRFQDDTGSIHLVNLYTEGDFRDGTAFGKNKEFRLFLKKGDGLKFTGIPIITPTTYEKMNYERVEITAGYWTVGKTIAPGKYKIEDVKSPGNISIVDEKGKYKQSEILGDGITLDLAQGDILKLTGTSISLAPAN